ncbi:Regulator of nonsense transcripts 3A [Frankliniella fusca]|uniref:Regulator of nonsense transcripts 3A n=1 Tax=Frankliniella fusca TaxID=407009 RepID=A0AAE1LA49_9NEOP|nr:Regulator of nonsense transcripts 3A [Frankliniella fusca]
MTETVSTTTPSSPKTKSKAGKQTSDGNDRPKTTEKVEKPPTKVVVRRLPPTMTLETFLDQVAPLPPVDYMYFVKADTSLAPNSFGRAYLHFIHVSDLLIFTEKFDNYVFVDGKGNEYPAIVEYAPFQRIPKQRPSRKKDPRIGTIENDPYYLEFMEALKAEETQRKSVSNKQHFLETSTTGSSAPKVTSTPLLEYLKARRADKLRTKEDKIAERKKREIERRKAREDARTAMKHNKLSDDGDMAISSAPVLKPPQASSETTADLDAIQTRYLRCMIGLDKDTSSLEQVSRCACCSPDTHAPSNCKILQERMHLLMLHLSPLKSLLKPTTETKMCSTASQKLNVHQADDAARIIVANPHTGFSADPFTQSCTPPEKFSDSNYFAEIQCNSLNIKEAKASSCPTVCSKPLKRNIAYNEKSTVKDNKQPPIADSSNKVLLQDEKVIRPISISSFKRESAKVSQSCQTATMSENHLKSCQVEKEVAVSNFCGKGVINETSKGPSKLTEFFKLLQSGHLQTTFAALPDISSRQMTTLQDIEESLLCKQKKEKPTDNHETFEFDDHSSHSLKLPKALPKQKKRLHLNLNGSNEELKCKSLHYQGGKRVKDRMLPNNLVDESNSFRHLSPGACALIENRSYFQQMSAQIAGHGTPSDKVSKEMRTARETSVKEVMSKRREDDRLKSRERRDKDKESRDLTKDVKRDGRRDSSVNQGSGHDKEKDKENQPASVEAKLRDTRRGGKSYQEERQRLNERRAAKSMTPKGMVAADDAEKPDNEEDAGYEDPSNDKKGARKEQDTSSFRSHEKGKYSEMYRHQTSREMRKYDKPNRSTKDQDLRRSYESKRNIDDRYHDDSKKHTSHQEKSATFDMKSEESRSQPPKEETRKKSYNQEREQRRAAAADKKSPAKKDTVPYKSDDRTVIKDSSQDTNENIKKYEKSSREKERRPSFDNSSPSSSQQQGEQSRSKAPTDMKTTQSTSSDGKKKETAPSKSDEKDKKDPRAERRIRNKDRPSIEIYRPGMGRFSRQRLEREKGLSKGSSTERDSPSPSPSPVPLPSKNTVISEKLE